MRDEGGIIEGGGRPILVLPRGTGTPVPNFLKCVGTLFFLCLLPNEASEAIPSLESFPSAVLVKSGFARYFVFRTERRKKRKTGFHTRSCFFYSTSIAGFQTRVKA